MKRQSTTVLIIMGIAAALAMVGIVTITVVVIPQEIEAAKSPTGECASSFKNRSSQICRQIT
jgi:hypothetical protein